MTYKYRYILTLALLLIVGKAVAQVHIMGSVYGGGNLADVQTNTVVNMGGGTVDGNVYGGGNVGSVGTYTTSADMKTFTFTANTGECNVTISGGTIGTGVEMIDDGTFANGNVYGAGKGENDTYWCEKAMVYKANVVINAGTVNGTVYGGGKIGRVENNAKVTIGVETPGDENVTPTIMGNVFGAGEGLATHGYSALVRGDTEVTVQGNAQVGLSVYGGGEKASVGRFKIVGGLPSEPQNGGTCKVTVKGNAHIGTDDDTDHNVFGSCQGVAAPTSFTPYDHAYKSMQTADNAPSDGQAWEYIKEYDSNYTGQKYIWEYYPTLDAYKGFLQTLALASHTDVEIGGSASVYGSVYGGGQRGVTLGNVDVNMVGGTVEQDVYGGGALADTNLGNWDANHYEETTEHNEGEDLYTRTGEEGNYIYTKVTDISATSGPYYRQVPTWAHDEGSAYYTTSVDLTGGTIKGDAYGGGLGQLGDNPVEAVVWGDINVALGGTFTGSTTVPSSSATGFYITNYTDDHSDVIKSGRIFGCNNLNGSPQGDVRVTVWKTVKGNTEKTGAENLKDANATHSYNVAAVYGGGNLANYAPAATGKKAYVRIETCDVSIESVYGGGNAAEAPETNVLVRGAYEINEVFGGGNGKDPYTLNGTEWITNSGADVRGNATTLLTGGLVHGAYGGSNKRGTIYGNVNIDTGTGSETDNSTNAGCSLDVEKLVGAGKDADVNGDLIMVMGCKPNEKIPVVYAGADNANVNGDVMLTITSGKFGKVFGGNNAGGYILGRIRLNIEETADCDPAVPIEIDELYLGGNEAEYSMYGYYNAGTADAPVYKSRTAAMAAITDPSAQGYTPAVTTMAGMEVRKTAPYAKPELNIISCTRIDKVYGGGYGTGATLYGDPIVNINMIPGQHTSSVSAKMTKLDLPSSDNSDKLGIIGDVFGGGNAAKIEGSTTVNIGTATTVNLTSIPDDDTTANVDESLANVKGAYITGNVYGGGKEADVTGNTFVNICAKEETDGSYTSVAFGESASGVTIGGDVFGGGKGKADTFTCEKAMIGTNDAGLNANYTDGNTNVVIGNGTINGTVYGGGQIGRVERNTTVTIGLGEGTATGAPTSAPEIKGNVFGAGAGEEEHGYAALVRGNPTVTIQGNAKVRHSVYGGGEIASVARYKVPKKEDDVQAAINEGYTEAALGMPYALKDASSGTCTVTVRGYAEIGPETAMQMTREGGPDDTGYVFGAGKGILPGGEYEYANGTTRRMVLYDAKDHTSGTQGTKWQWVDYPNHSESNNNVWEYFANLDEYIKFIQTLALSSRTDVTITGNAFVKGSVYGGSENGIVQFDTKVKIQGGQIGCGKDETEAHPDDYWTTNSEDPTKFAECSSWEFQEPYAPYDPYATNLYNDQYYYDSNHTQEAAGGAVVATDGHTYYGNVFGGGSGSIPYFDATKGQSVYLHSAGQVKGNTNVTISGGHILTNVYGGCEATNVGGTANVTMIDGTVGVPRTDEQIIAHPLTGYIFGGGKGDQRIFFNKDTNVKDAVVTVEGGRVYGSVYGGGEDGHVLRNVTLTIGKQTTTGEGDEAVTTTSGPKIGTKGTSYYDGHVFGGGRGFGGDALTAGNVGGSVDVNILDGEILGSVYGGGRLASVGYGLYLVDEEVNGVKPYGIIRPDNEYDGSYTNPSTEEAKDFFTKGRGHINMTISGGTIGNDNEYGYNADNQLTHTKGGNVFAGGMGRMYKLDEITPISSLDWWKLGCVKSTKLTITGGTIKSNVYGGGELGQVVGAHTAKNAANADVSVGTEIIINGGTIGSEVKDGSNVVQYTFGSVFGGGYGSLLEDKIHNEYPKFIAGLVKEDTKIDMQNGAVKASIYGGGEMASVGESTTSGTTTTVTGSTYVSVSGGTVGIAPITVDDAKRYFGGAKMGNVYGGGSGLNNIVRSGRIFKNTNVTISGSNTRIYHNVYGGGAYGTVGDFDYDTGSDGKVTGVNDLATTGTGVATVTITGGTIGYDGKENGMVFGSSRGDINEPGARDDHTAWVYDTHVIIGTSGSDSGPQINGTVYGGGENGHTFNNTVVTVNGGTIGIASNTDPGYTVTSNDKQYAGAAYPYRGNVYGGGCGTDKYYSNHSLENHSGAGDYYNPKAGIVYGTTTVNINGGTVVRNVYGAGAMGSVGKTTWTTTETTTGSVTTTTKSATTSGGSTTININGGIIGVSGTVGDGNVFGAARGSKAVVQADRDDLSRVSVTNVNVSGGLVKGNVYGGGELGDVGTIVKNTTDYNYTWEKSDGGSNVAENNKITGTNTNTGICNVTITGGTIGSTTAGTGNVFGGGKGDANTWWCEKAMAFATNVSISGSDTKVYGTVYGGGEVGRVEDDTKVIIGTANGSDEPDIKGNVFGAGKGMATRGYSALVRGNSIVTIQGSAKVGGNVFGGGEEASLGRFNLVGGLPKSPASGGSSEVTIQDNAKIGSSGTGNHVYGAGQGVNPNYVTDTTNPNKYKDYKSMQLYDNRPKDDKDVQGTYWDYYVDDDGKTDENFVWVYYKTEPEYQAFLNTLALASHPTVTIAENATIYGDVYGGGQRGITLGNVAVNITGGTVKKDVYGGGSLADTNKGNWDADRYVEATVTTGESVAGLYTMTTVDNKPVYTPTASNATAVANTTYYRKGTWAADKYNTTTHVTTFKTNVTLTGGTVIRNVYGGGLGQLAKGAEEGVHYTEEDEEVIAGTKTTIDWKIEPVEGVKAVEAKVYGDVSVKMNEKNGENGKENTDNCEVKGTIFGCNNLNGSPQNNVTVHVWKTVRKNTGTVIDKPDRNTKTYETTAVYGGGNLATYYPDDVTTREIVKTNVIIDGCGETSIGSVYGGGNAASVPATDVIVNATYEVGEVFGGGNGKEDVSYDGGVTYVTNPGANVGYLAYPDAENHAYDTKENRIDNYGYGIGKTHATIYGGTVHSVYGGSNTRGNIRVEARTTLDDQDECSFYVGEAYGGGRNAPMDGDAVLDIGCISGMEKACGGAAEADVNGDVVLNITNGTYGQVFGGNDLGGAIRGSITVNIEETGCRPVIIGELYGGGNQAAYSVYGYELDAQGKPQPLRSLPSGATKQRDPQVNVKSFTSIGTIYGGGYGAPATMVGNPTLNINVYEGRYAEKYNGNDNVISENAMIVGSTVKYPGDTDYDSKGYLIPSHAKGAIGAIGTVFGGGNAAEVIGNPTVNIGTEAGEEVFAVIDVVAGTSLEGKHYYTHTGTGTTSSDYTEVTSGSAEADTTYYQKTVKGADIRGDVFGAGNNAKVTGNTNVQIGKKVETSTTSDPDPDPDPTPDP